MYEQQQFLVVIVKDFAAVSVEQDLAAAIS